MLCSLQEGQLVDSLYYNSNCRKNLKFKNKIKVKYSSNWNCFSLSCSVCLFPSSKCGVIFVDSFQFLLFDVLFCCPCLLSWFFSISKELSVLGGTRFNGEKWFHERSMSMQVGELALNELKVQCEDCCSQIFIFKSNTFAAASVSVA